VDLYSASLGLALAGVGLSVLLVAASAALGAIRPKLKGQLGRLAQLWAWFSLSLVAFSILYHRVIGHRPGTAQGMSWHDYLLEHTAFVVVVLTAIAVLAWLRRTGPPTG
jgi:hypothetical protein